MLSPSALQGLAATNGGRTGGGISPATEAWLTGRAEAVAPGSAPKAWQEESPAMNTRSAKKKAASGAKRSAPMRQPQLDLASPPRTAPEGMLGKTMSLNGIAEQRSGEKINSTGKASATTQAPAADSCESEVVAAKTAVATAAAAPKGTQLKSARPAEDRSTQQAQDVGTTTKAAKGKPTASGAAISSSASAPKLTVPHQLQFKTEARSRPKPKTTEELQLEAIAAAVATIKAKPVNRKILDSAGDLGVPRVQRPKPTQVHEFHLSSSMRTHTPAPEPAPKLEAPRPSSARGPPAVASKTTKASLAQMSNHGEADKAAERPHTSHLRVQSSVPPAVASKTTAASKYRLAEQQAARNGLEANDASDRPATSEELELAAALKEMKEIKARSEKWRKQLAAVLADTGSKLPARSTAQLTIPQEFHFHGTSRSAPSSPTASPRGERASTLAEKVAEFSKTPSRFRSLGKNEKPQPSPTANAPWTPTVPIDIELASAARAGRAPKPKSREELEEEMMASMKAFKARPVSKKVLESAGDLGVPRVQRAAPTQVQEFRLSTSNAKRDNLNMSAASDHTEDVKPFKARPVNRAILEGKATGLTQSTPRKVTQPKSPHFKLDERAAARPQVSGEPEPEFATFKARPMPTFSPSPAASKTSGTSTSRPVTEVVPFNLSGEARHAAVEEARHRLLALQEEEERRAREFKARKMPVGEGWAPQHVEAPPLEAKPFTFRYEERAALQAMRHEEQLRQQHESEKRAREVHARPIPTSLDHPFAPTKSTKPLTEIHSFTERSSIRAEERKQWEAQVASEREVRDEERRKREAEEQARIAAELAEIRAKAAFRARPAKVLKAKPFEVVRGNTEPTKPQSPDLSSTKRFGKARRVEAA